MIFKIVTLFPEFFHSPLSTGLPGKAIEAQLFNVELIDIKNFGMGKHKKCDDYPYGGGSGMVLSPEPLVKALESAKTKKTKTIATMPNGRLLNQKLIKELSDEEELCIICGHYEGIDERVIESHVDLEISIGDYILSGGEFAALVLIDAVVRYIPGFMSNSSSLEEESFEKDLLEYPHYTRPASYSGMDVPEVLLSGNHSEIEKWRLKKSIEKTKDLRPDLYKKFLMRKLKGE